MSDSDDDTAFASADEGDDKMAGEQKGARGNSKDAASNVDAKTGKADGQKEEKVMQQEKGATGKGKKKGKQTKGKAKSSDKDVNVVTKSEKSEKDDKVGGKSESTQKTTSKTKKEPEKKTENNKEPDTSQTETRTVTSKEPDAIGTGTSNTDTQKEQPEEKKMEVQDKETLFKSPSGQSIARETPDDDTKKKDIKSALDQLAGNDEDDSDDKQEGSWGWGGWGSSILNVAQTSVTTFTSQVGEGFNTLMDTMENTLGAIPPEEMAFVRTSEEKKTSETTTEQPKSQGDSSQKKTNDEDEKIVKTEEKKEEVDEKKTDEAEEVKEDQASGGGWFSSWGVSSLKDAVSKTTNIVQSTSKNLVTGGMDVLETVGKKAFDFIEDHDPGLHKSKEILFDRGNKPNLSQILKEAKEESEYKAEIEKESEEARKAHFGFLFDEYQGISHLEALEILSNQCEKKVQMLLSSLPSETLASIKAQLIEIKQIFEHEDDEDDEDQEQEHEFIKVMTELLTDLHLGTTPNKINKVHEKIRKEITDFYENQEKGEKVEPKIMHQKAIQSLAELTSKAMEQFHKAGELILIQKDSDRNFIDRAKCLLSINKVLSTEVSILSTKFSHCLNKLGEDLEDESSINQMVTNVYLEASNSSTYIHDGFQLLLPCLQQAAIENTPGITE